MAMSKEQQYLARVLLVIGWFGYNIASETYPEIFAKTSAEIRCSYDSLVLKDWSTEFHKGCMVRHGFIVGSSERG